MKRLFVSPQCIRGNTATLGGDDYHHLVRVLRLSQGADVSLADGSGQVHEGTIAAIEGSTAIVDLRRSISAPAPPEPRLVLMDGLARASRNELILQKCTELGVDAFIHVVCARSIARPKEHARKLRRWSEVIRQAARQSERTLLPTLAAPVPFAEGLHAWGDTANASPDGGAALDRKTVRLLASLEGAPLSDYEPQLRDRPNTVVLAVGPEGGFTEEEVRMAKMAGFAAVSMGSLVMRTETAAIALLATVGYLTGRHRQTVRAQES